MFEKDKCNLLAILEAINKIQKYTDSISNADDFFADEKNFDATLMNFIIIGEMVTRLSEEFIKKHVNIDWFKIKGFRNIVAHNYFGIDAEEVWQIIKDKIPLLKEEIEKILKNIK
ncbi:MAG: DUF86 domain-containing protein [Paludibacter sp.]|nr:DUF86 domain-containing protein [Paludibacter sp.]